MNFKTNPLVAIVNLSLLILLAAGTANAQIKPDLSELDKKSGVDATLEGNLLKIDWDDGENVSDRKSAVSGKSESVSVDLGGRRIITKQNNQKRQYSDI